MSKKKQFRRRSAKPAAEQASAPAKPPASGRLKIILFCLIVFAASFAVYSNTLSSDFIWDDEYLIINNSQIKSFSHLPNVFKTYVGYGSENINNFYRPVQEISNMIDYAVWGLKPFGFHLTNVIMHSLAAVMVMLFIFTVSEKLLAGFFGALFFAIHPVHSEAIAYIAGRADPLYAFFMLVSLTLFIRSVKTVPRGALSNIGLYIASIFFFTVSLLAKEMIFIMPLLAYLYMFFFLKGTEKNDLYRRFRLRWVPYAVIVAGYGVLRATVLSFSDIAPASAFTKIPFLYRLLTFFRTVGVYFRLLLLPTDLHMERSLRITNSVFDIEALLAALMMAGIVWMTYTAYKNNKRVLAFAIVWFFANLLPVSNIIPINSFIAEHWIYMASIGPFMLIGLGLAWLWQAIPAGGRSLRIGFVLAVLFPLWLYSELTFNRNKDWKDEISFFNSTLKYHPKNARLYLNLGNTYYEKGQTDQAIEQYLKSIAINKNYAVAYGNIGSAYLSKKDIDNAEKYISIAIQLQNNYPIAHYNLGIIHFKNKRYKEAIEELKTATDQLPQLY
ncbi:MAG: tetratricopeptide repeat protein, partial [Candidatus Omnitrophota bacterium]